MSLVTVILSCYQGFRFVIISYHTFQKLSDSLFSSPRTTAYQDEISPLSNSNLDSYRVVKWICDLINLEAFLITFWVLFIEVLIL